jgi:hypothetical protein
MPVILMLLAAWLVIKVPWLLAANAVASAVGRPDRLVVGSAGRPDGGQPAA